jgi:hypothetical protein
VEGSNPAPRNGPDGRTRPENPGGRGRKSGALPLSYTRCDRTGDGSRTRCLQIQKEPRPAQQAEPTVEEIASDGAGGESRTLRILITRQVLGHPSITGTKSQHLESNQDGRRMRPARSPSLTAARRAWKPSEGDRADSNRCSPGSRPGAHSVWTAVTMQ